MAAPRRFRRVLVGGALALSLVGAAGSTRIAAQAPRNDSAMVDQGRQIFRFDTFGDEAFWTDVARMHEVVAGSVSPRTALSVGLKVDSEALPPGILATADLDDPATTVALLKLDAVVGLKGTVESVGGRDRLVRLGITCALCHSTVDNSVLPGIGRRLDGWANGDLDVGAIVALSPAIPENLKTVYRSWGRGRYDPRFNIDGQSTPLVIPPAYGLADVRLETYTGEGEISYWNAYVAVTQMHGRGTFVDPRLGIDITFSPDLVRPKLPALFAYQASLRTPPPPAASFDQSAARRGQAVFNGPGRCVNCHTPPVLSDVNRGVLHEPAETGMDPAYAQRTTTKLYRSTPLRALWQHPPYFHDGSAATLAAVVDHYDRVRRLGLTSQQKSDLVEYLKSL